MSEECTTVDYMECGTLNGVTSYIVFHRYCSFNGIELYMSFLGLLLCMCFSLLCMILLLCCFIYVIGSIISAQGRRGLCVIQALLYHYYYYYCHLDCVAIFSAEELNTLKVSTTA